MQPSPFIRRFVATFFLAIVGCASPTIPLPPPELPTALSFDTTTAEWTIEGSCNQGALVTAFNENTGLGSVIEDRDEDGHYQIKLRGTLCDVAWVQQQIGLDTSALTTFVLQPKVNGLPVDPNECK